MELTIDNLKNHNEKYSIFLWTDKRIRKWYKKVGYFR
jgi:hypothetical protein